MNPVLLNSPKKGQHNHEQKKAFRHLRRGHTFFMKLRMLLILDLWRDHPIYIELIIEFEQIVVMTVELSFMHKKEVMATGTTYKNLNKMKYSY